MKASFESLSASPLKSFLVRRFEEKSFSAPYHLHPELELTLILSGSGKRYVGSKMNDFYPGDFVLLGSNLPHCWKTEGKKNAEKSSSIVVQFQKYFLGDCFFEKPEMKLVVQLLNKSVSGIKFTGDTSFFKQGHRFCPALPALRALHPIIGNALQRLWSAALLPALLLPLFPLATGRASFSPSCRRSRGPTRSQRRSRRPSPD